jgi:hypothetical protein
MTFEKQKKRRKHNSDVLIKIQNRNFKVKARDSEIFDDEEHGGAAMDELEYKELFKVEYNSAFTKIVTTTEYRGVIAPYLNITSDEQTERLGTDKPHHHDHADDNSTAARFARIERQVRVALRRQTGSAFIKQLEQTLVDFIQNGAEQDQAPSSESKLPLVLLFQDGYHRLMAHGVCQYYDLKSVSVSYSGERVTVISKPKSSQPLQLPPMPLHEYLKHLKEQESNMFDTIGDDSESTHTPFSRVHTRTFIHNYKRDKQAREAKAPQHSQKKTTKPKKRKY